MVITFLDCTTHQDMIQSESGSFLTANTEFGPLELHIVKVKRVDFEWYIRTTKMTSGRARMLLLQ